MRLTYQLNELDKAAAFILKNTTSKLLFFEAEMGTGKTTLIKTLVKQLGSLDNVSSPTFSLVNTYKTKQDSIHHFDLYRIESEEELYDFGIETYFDNNAFVFVEWPELLKENFTENFTIISIVLDEKLNRVLELKNSI
ncbi:tRNA (adenosine(37)-N6)-threonylcarbamoyltransferase complex ATPase subunit type 1 TsaE [Aurantibacter sp.]|uniref:tRNA (adenosine(37)-N6)-threonylcarbamoyltransferase complex ATPase subunit type 1 TsaE n=1 Tax=Aurantibacter sp. TaxID=2807103 RepID=UPI0035C7C97B